MTEVTIESDSDGVRDTVVLGEFEIIVLTASRLSGRRFSYHLYREPCDRSNNSDTSVLVPAIFM